MSTSLGKITKKIYQKVFPSVVKAIVWCVQIISEIIIIPVQIFRFFQTPKKCPPIKDQVLLLSASEIAHRIRKKQISSVSVVQAYISRINEVNPIINAVIENRFREALLEAEKADDTVKNSGLDEEQIEEKFPLFGVPITIKGSIGVAGLDHSAGRFDRQKKADVDAVAVQNVKAAGAIPLLVSNVPELCMNWETTNKAFGTTLNPYNTLRTPGGSSGGEAALLACGGSVIGLGSDVGGSLRLPAHFCGVWGHKPSPGLVSVVGHYPDCKNREEWAKIFTIGPLARYATDLKLLLNVIAEPDAKKELQLDRMVDVKKIKMFYMNDDPKSFLAYPFTPEVITAVEKVVSHFDLICDLKCRKVKMPLMKLCAELSYLPMLHVDGVDCINPQFGQKILELIKYFCGLSNHYINTLIYETLVQCVPILFSNLMGGVYKARDKLRNDFIKLLGTDGVFILPTTSSEAAYHYDSHRRAFSNVYVTIFNSLGFPVTNCPVMFSASGLPIGIQVVAAPKQDRLCLSVAEEIERAFGGWKFD